MSRRPLARVVRHRLAKVANRLRIGYFRLMGVQIGKRSTISMGAHIDVTRGRIVIGNRVAISHGTYILSHAGFRRIKEGEATVIEDGVRIFVNAVILPGVTIGHNSIVGAGAVVMKDVPPNVVVMGNPARVVQQLAPDGSPEIKQ